MVTTYKMTLEDFLSFHNDLSHHSNLYERNRKLWLFIMMIPTFALGYVLTAFVLPRPESPVLFYLLPVGVGILFTLLLRPLLKDLHGPFAIWIARQQLKKHNVWPKDITLHLDDTHVEMHVVRGKVSRTTQIPWTSIFKVNEDETHRFLYFEEDEALIIPKARDGITEVEQSEIDRILEKHINTEKHTSSR
ncbi:YcxB family protein [Exiguobacterium sp. ZOR0005]|uniref:YcxB family protein n=1 Tax=Exiguobacterium sp. ZOR0005 TaxID=1339226 RepID=UPI000648E4E4|nr:YcxB family protein [Exiguobacterium sp. ZOR0005]